MCRVGLRKTCESWLKLGLLETKIANRINSYPSDTTTSKAELAMHPNNWF
jgi:hypothetical protein